jgi:hypothetical protein
MMKQELRVAIYRQCCLAELTASASVRRELARLISGKAKISRLGELLGKDQTANAIVLSHAQEYSHDCWHLA